MTQQTRKTHSFKLRGSCRSQTRFLVAAVSGCFVSGAMADPAGYTVVNGTAVAAQVGNVLTITNSAGAILNWQQFGVAAGNTTHFQQPAASSAVLNRVLAGAPISEIYGTLSSNGRVWLINPAGILVGASGRVDTAGFVASTLGVTNSDFLAGRLNFGAAEGTTAGFGAVTNHGAITTSSGGSVYLVAPNVTNNGIITTPQGETILAAGQTVQLIDTATPGVRVEITGSEGNATNLGDIVSDAGRIGIAGVIVRNSGTLNASSVVSEGGRVFLKASQDAYVDGAGRIVTTGTRGGSVEVLGNTVSLAETSRIEADATSVGAGGTVLVLATEITEAHGVISARGGATSGDGGLVETSAPQLNTAGIRVNAGASNGRAGTWLLDPNDIVVSHSVAGGPPTSNPPGTSTVFDADINTSLFNGTSVTLDTSTGTGGYGDVVIMPSVVIGTGVSNSGLAFTVRADRDITIDNARIGGVTNSALGINLTAIRDILITSTAMETNGAAMNIASGNNFTLTANAGQGSIVSTAGCSSPASVDCRSGPYTTGGLQTVTATGTLKVEANVGGGFGVALFSGGGQAISANNLEIRGGLTGSNNDAWITNRATTDQTINAHSGAVDARVGPLGFPVIEVSLRLLQTFEALAFQWCVLGVSDTAFNFAFAIRIGHAAGQCDGPVVREQIAIQRVQRRIVDVRLKHAFAQVIEHDRASDAAQASERLLMEFGPDPRTGLEGEQANRLAAVAEREHEQPRAPVTVGAWIAHHRTAPVVDLRFFAWRGDDDRAGGLRRGLTPAQRPDEALDAGVAPREAVAVDQVLIDRLGVAALAERQFDEVEVGFAGAAGGTAVGVWSRLGVGGHRWPVLVWRFC